MRITELRKMLSDIIIKKMHKYDFKLFIKPQINEITSVKAFRRNTWPSILPVKIPNKSFYDIKQDSNFVFNIIKILLHRFHCKKIIK